MSSPLDDARRLNQAEPIEQFETGGRNYFVFCGRMVQQGHAPGCPWLSMPRIVAALEDRESMIHSMARVWGKAQGALEEGTDYRAEYKQYVEMGDILYHATDGAHGRCGNYFECQVVPSTEPVLTGSGP